MHSTTRPGRDFLTFVVLLLVAFAAIVPHAAWASQASPEPSQATVIATGSATVGPILQAAAEPFSADHPDVDIMVERTSSGAGFEVFCAGDADIGMSGRTIRDEEAAACSTNGVDFDEFEVAFDGVAVVVNPAVDFVDCLTVEQLGALWSPGSTVATWQDLDPAWPAEPLALYGTGEQSGTYQFFTQVVVGEEGVSRDDYTVTDGHPATAEGVIGDPAGLGFLPFPRYVEVQDQVRLLGVDDGTGCVAPSAESIQDGSYAALSRKLYVYVSHESLDRPEVASYLRFVFSDAATFAASAGLVPSPADVYADNLDRLEALLGVNGSPVATPAG